MRPLSACSYCVSFPTCLFIQSVGLFSRNDPLPVVYGRQAAPHRNPPRRVAGLHSMNWVNFTSAAVIYLYCGRRFRGTIGAKGPLLWPLQASPCHLGAMSRRHEAKSHCLRPECDGRGRV